jgi:hypothetical protein
MDEQVIYEPYEPPPLFRHAEILEMSLVVPTPFRTWLERQSSDRTFRSECKQCPIAEWLNAVYPGFFHEVEEEDIIAYRGLYDGERRVCLPAWAVEFVDLFDNHIADMETQTASVTAILAAWRAA